VQVPGLPTPPWNLPSPAGACDRCIKALQAGGHYAIPSAAGESLLCEDANARLTCERQIAEAAPASAEQAAREGDCAAALAIVAAGVKVGLSPDAFGAAKAQCGLR
jgi:hypothetical protein